VKKSVNPLLAWRIQHAMQDDQARQNKASTASQLPRNDRQQCGVCGHMYKAADAMLEARKK
jgi:hypothetical protein